MAKAESKELISCDFDIRANIPQEAVEFAVEKAAGMGIRGFIEKVEDGHYKGKLQGGSALLEAFKGLLAAAAELAHSVLEFIMKNIETIAEATLDLIHFVSK